MLVVSLVYAWSAGVLATVNPCGFAMLPAYVSLYLGAREPGFAAQPLRQRLGRGVWLGLVVTLGFVAVFSAVGLVIAAGGRALVRYVPWSALLIGIALAGLGVALLLGRRMPVPMLHVRPVKAPGARGLLLFGMAYALASLSCTLPIFLVLVGGTLATRGLAEGVIMFVGYALGMGSVLTALTVALALFKGALIGRLRRVSPLVERAGALILIGVGLYLVAYWLPQLR